MNKYLLNTGLLLAFVYLLFGSCAQVGSISGGEKDTLPPIPIKFSPDFGITRFDDDKIFIRFNEYFELKDVFNQFVVSPPLEEMPEVKLKGKVLEIRILGDLKSETTYNFDFNQSVADFTEANVLNGFQYVCSTGDFLDTMQVSGVLKDARTMEPVEAAYVYLYRYFNDTVPAKVLPDYLAKSNKRGEFRIRNVAMGKYYVFALKDMNTNLKYDQTIEKIAFLSGQINTSVKQIQVVDTLTFDSLVFGKRRKVIDTIEVQEIIRYTDFRFLPDSIELFMFDEDDENQYIKNAKRFMPGAISLSMKRPVTKDFSIDFYTGKLLKKELLHDWNEQKDSLVLWILNSDVVARDTIGLYVNYLKQDSLKKWVKTTDTLKMGFDFEKLSDEKEKSERGKESAQNIQKLSDLQVKILNIKQNFLDVNQNIKIQSNIPLQKYNAMHVLLFELADSLVKKYDQKRLKSGVFMDETSSGITEARRISATGVKAVFANEKSTNVSVKSLNFDLKKAPVLKYNELKDTLFIEFDAADVKSKDTLKFVLNYQMKLLIGEQPFADTMELAMERSVFEVFGTKVKFELLPVDSVKRSYELKFKAINDGRKYALIFPQKWATDIFGHLPDSSYNEFLVRPDDYYGNLVLNLKKQPNELLFELSEEKGEIVRKLTLTEKNVLSIEKLPPGKYVINAYSDANKNGKWDTGDFKANRQPEKVYLLKKTLTIRSGWDTEEDWDFSKK